MLISYNMILFFTFLGLSGKKLEFMSVPIKFISTFSVESAGTLSRTVEATVYVSKIQGGITTDFGKKETDIFEINNSLANKTMLHTIHQA